MHAFGAALQVVVNWKSELQSWLPGVRCIYYVGKKDERARQFTQEVLPQQFNALITTYELIMRVSAAAAAGCNAAGYSYDLSVVPVYMWSLSFLAAGSMSGLACVPALASVLPCFPVL